PPSSTVPDLPPHFDDVFRCALAKVPGKRFGSAGAFVGALRGEDLDSLLAPLLAGMESDAPASAPGAPAADQETQALTPAAAALARAGRVALWVAAAVIVIAAAL